MLRYRGDKKKDSWGTRKVRNNRGMCDKAATCITANPVREKEKQMMREVVDRHMKHLRRVACLSEISVYEVNDS